MDKRERSSKSRGRARWDWTEKWQLRGRVQRREEKKREVNGMEWYLKGGEERGTEGKGREQRE